MQRSELSLFWTGFSATFSGVGLSRFAYTALMPQLVLAGWFTGEQVAYLGAANLLGYLIGALLAAHCAQRWGAVPVMRASWWVVTLSLLACSVPQEAFLFGTWRLLSGIAGAMLMVLGPSVAMSATTAERRTALGPLMFCGIGAGVLLSATLVPVLAQWNLTWAWWGLAVLAAVFGAWGLHHARRLPPPLASSPATTFEPLPTSALWTASVVLVFLAYMADAFGFVPHTVFWADYLARELELGPLYGAWQWACFGLGALAGPLLAARCATRWGWWHTTTGAYALKAVAIAMPLYSSAPLAHAISGFMVGALSPGMAAIISGYLMQLVGSARHKHMWGYATAAFALFQALSGYAMAALYVASGSYRTLFIWAAASLVLGTLCIWASRPRTTTM